MKTDKEWEARAQELAIPPSKSGLWGIHHTEPWMNATTALQLGREMAEEAAREEAKVRVAGVRDFAQRAADARAEEIARKIVDGVPGVWWAGHPQANRFMVLHSAADIARSTITKPKEPPTWTMEEAMREPVKDEAAIRADEREKVAKRIEACEGQWRNVLGDPVMCVATAAAVARAGEPKTREQVLEQALREVPCTCSAALRHGLPSDEGLHGATCAFDAARRALEWKP